MRNLATGRSPFPLFSKPLRGHSLPSIAGSGLSYPTPRTSAPTRTPFLDVSRLEVRAGRNWLRLRLDDYGYGEPVPINLGTSGGRAVRLHASCGTERIAVSLGRNEPRLREVDLVTRPGEPAQVWVAPRDVGPPGRPADHLTVSTPDGALNIAVWVEPVTGVWRPDDTDPPAAPREETALRKLRGWLADGGASAPQLHVLPTAKPKESIIACVEPGRAWLYGHRRGGRRPPRHIGTATVPGSGEEAVTTILPRAAHVGGGSILQWSSDTGIHVLDVAGAVSAASATWRRLAPVTRHRPGSATVLADGGLLLSDDKSRWQLFHGGGETFSHVADCELDISGTPRLRRDGTVTTGAARFHPPYLWRGPRPRIRHVPGARAITCGSELTIRADGDSLDPGARAALVSPARDGSPSFLWLPMGPAKPSPKGWTFRAGALSGPGERLLLLVDAAGVPSEGYRVTLTD